MGGTSLNLCPDKYKVVLVDVAGTTTSLNFIKETLLPFAVKNAQKFITERWDDEAVKEAVGKLGGEKELDVAEAVELFEKLTEENSENSGAKSLQGRIYEDGYASGQLKGHVFPDVKAAFESWSKFVKIGVFSTGSVESQKLLFANSCEGDISSHISRYFDQTVGSKLESSSYEKIAVEFGAKPEEVIFATDNVEEARAANAAGLYTILVSREDSSETDGEFPVTSTFGNLEFEISAKRKNDDVEEVENRPAKVLKCDDKANAETSDAKMEAAEVAIPETSVDEQPQLEKDKEESTEESVANKTEQTADNATTEKSPDETSDTEKETNASPTEHDEEQKTDEPPPPPQTVEKQSEKENTSDAANVVAKTNGEKLAEKQETTDGKEPKIESEPNENAAVEV